MLPSSERNNGLEFYQSAIPSEQMASGQMSSKMMSPAVGVDYDEFSEPPLLEELGIDFGQIRDKTMFVLLPTRINAKSMEEGDLAGPFVFCILLGIFLLLSGKLYFGYIYGFGIIGCVGMYTVLNLMSDTDLDIHRIISILGYCILPIVLLSSSSVAIDLSGPVGLSVATAAVAWSTLSAVRFIETVFKMREQRWLIAYPIALLYTCFAMITVFGKV